MEVMEPETAVKKKNGKKKDSMPDEVVTKDKVLTYHFQGMKIKKKSTIVYFEREVVNELKEGEEENTTWRTWYPIESEIPPHKDFLDALKALRKPALQLGEIVVEESTHVTYNVLTVKITGDMEMQQSRCEMVLGHKVKRTDKIIPIPTGEYVMYGDSDFEGAAATTKKLEKLKEEAWAYCFDGKFGTPESADPNQLPLALFYRNEKAEKKLQTHFTQ